jgi:hypothetical protein
MKGFTPHFRYLLLPLRTRNHPLVHTVNEWSEGSVSPHPDQTWVPPDLAFDRNTSSTNNSINESINRSGKIRSEISDDERDAEKGIRD